jgi:histidinol-phosphate aminotransferase
MPTMSSDFPFELLRVGPPEPSTFTIAEIPHRAKLDQNESPVDVPVSVKQALAEAVAEAGWHRYPQPKRYREIKARFGEAIGQPAERIVLTVGCDQMILAAFWAAGGAGRRARIFEPTYPMFAAYARITETAVDRVVLGPDFDVAAQGLGDPVDLLCLVSPNNPTGNGPGRALVQQALARDCLVFVDEASADYAGETVLDLVDAHPNLLVGRSLSKATLAGVRLGFGVGHPDLIRVLEQLLFAPYHLNALQLVVADRYAEIQPHLAAMVRDVVAERERVTTALEALGLRVWPSRANFVLFAVEDAARVNGRLLEHGIRLRDVSGMHGMGEHLRVTIGTAADNDLFLEAITDACG